MGTTSTHVEVERKYQVHDGGAASLDLTQLAEALPDGFSVGDGELVELDATYFDTADHALFHAPWTLRRRTGGADAGWHLKLPDGEDRRVEVRAALGRSTSTVPLPLRRFTWIHTRGAALVPIARIATSRTSHQVRNGEGEAMAEIAVDQVSAWRLGPLGPDDNEPLSWQEIEVELVAGDQDLFTPIHAFLKAHGARRSVSVSKLAQTLGQEPTTDGAGVQATAGKLARWSPASAVLDLYLREQIDQIHDRDPQVRLKASDSVHKMRVATRRLRSALKTFAPLYVKDATRGLRSELAWLADELGRARDAEVQRGRLHDALDREADRQFLGRGVRNSVDGHAAREQRSALAVVTGVLNSERYQLLILALDELAANPPLTPRAGKAAAKVLRDPVAAAYKEVAAATRTASRLPTGPERDEALHEARKAAKRARYAAEAVSPAYGKASRRFAAAMESLQEVLGEHHDGVVMLDRLHELALGQSSTAAAFTYGRLHALQDLRQDRVDAAIETAWRHASDKSLRSWLR